MTGSVSRRPRDSRYVLFILGLITLLAFVLRFWQLDSVPPGWRDDELINSLVISQKVVDGDLAVYYADASGHEALYHILNGIMLAWFGPGVAGIRWLSALLGTLTVPLTFLVGRRLFGSLTGLLAAAALAVSFWSLMYSRVGIRHVLTPVLALATFYFFLRGLGVGNHNNPWAGNTGRDIALTDGRKTLFDFLLAAVFMGLGFYTYFASRGVPLILVAFSLYLLLFARTIIWRRFTGLLLMFGVAAMMAVPLLVTLSRQPESEARVAELAVPLVEARSGNFQPLLHHVVVTLNMAHADGDDEWLYNIPHRPLFNQFGALFFWAGTGIALIYSLVPLYRLARRLLRRNDHRAFSQETGLIALSCAFLLLWWAGGISPGFVSVPPASLGHTILAQPAVYLLLMLPIGWFAVRISPNRKMLPLAIGVLLVIAIAARDLPDYFRDWPQRGMTRFLYRADIHEVAAFLNDNPQINDFGITGLLAGPWDRLALATDLSPERADQVAPRWYNPERVLLLNPSLNFSGYPELSSPYGDLMRRIPEVGGVGSYRLFEVTEELSQPDFENGDRECFENGLCLLSAVYDKNNGTLELLWLVGDAFILPPVPLISNPPPPGVYAGPRLQVFAQLQDMDQNFLLGDDGLWVDAQTLQPGDRFLQQHRLPAPEDQTAAWVVFGLYDPKTGERVLTVDGRDFLRLAIGE